MTDCLLEGLLDGKPIPDKATIWSFRYGLNDGCELSQDASYITADPGHQKKFATRTKSQTFKKSLIKKKKLFLINFFKKIGCTPFNLIQLPRLLSKIGIA